MKVIFKQALAFKLELIRAKVAHFTGVFLYETEYQKSIKSLAIFSSYKSGVTTKVSRNNPNNAVLYAKQNKKISIGMDIIKDNPVGIKSAIDKNKKNIEDISLGDR